METSQDIPTGRDGLAIAAGFTPLKDAAPEPATFGPGEDGLRAAAELITETRAVINAYQPGTTPTAQPESKPIYQDWEGAPLKDYSVSVEKVGRDLSAFHAAQAREQEADADVALAVAAAEVRPWQEQAQPGVQTPSPPRPPAADAPQPDQQPGQEAPQPQASDAPASEAPGSGGLTPRVREALAIPEVRDAITQKMGEAEQVRAVYGQAITEAQQLTATAVMMAVPELAGIPPEQYGGALEMLRAQNPQRHAQVMQQLSMTQQLFERGRAIEQQNAEIERQRFAAWADEQDKLFESEHKDDFSTPEQRRKVRAGVIDYLTNVAGIPEDQLPELWNQPLIRAAATQKIIFDAARYHAGKEAARNAVPVGVPPVQRPGSAGNNRPDAGERIERLQSRMSGQRGSAQLSTAASLIAAKRAARGR
jgi:hypothetical protein